ncbi:hypothetical protein MMC31_003829 [Peltigera leucophlebia]|nr:hypothetical protein [Peltigera leucophlebia]
MKQSQTTNKSRLRLVLRDTFAVSDYKYKSVTEKAQALMNLNAEITLQKPELKLHSDYLVMILMRSMPPEYDALLVVLNMKEDPTWDETLSFLRAKETELLDMEVVVDLFEDEDLIEVDPEVALEVDPEVDSRLSLEYDFREHQ